MSLTCRHIPESVQPRPGTSHRRTRATGGAAVEVWQLEAAALGRLITQIPAPLAIGTVELANGGTAPGFLCEAHAVAAAEDITAWGGWRAYCEDAVTAE